MAYITQTDVEDRFTPERIAQFFSSQLPSGAISPTATAAAVAAAIRDADAKIDTMLIDAGYVVPLVAPIPDIIVSIACDLVPWLGIRRRPEFAGDKALAIYADLYNEAIATIDKIRAGKQRINAALIPSNEGGMLAQFNPTSAQPKYFEPDEFGNGGFNDGSF